MVAFNKFLSSVSLALVYASLSSAAPSLPNHKFSTHRVRALPNDVQVEVFHPATSFETFGEGIAHPMGKSTGDGIESAAVTFVQAHLGVESDAVKFKTGYTSEVATHAYVKQSHKGVPFANAVANIVFKDNKVVAFGSSFVKPSKIAENTPSITAEQAIATAEQKLGGTYNQFPTSLEFFAKSDSEAVLTHVVQVQNEETGAWFEAFVDAHSGELVSVTDFVTDATYRVLPIQKEILTQGFENLSDPQDSASSPNGWHTVGGTTTTDTSGNNVIAYKGTQSNTTTQSSSGQFIFTHDPSQAPTVQVNVDAARTNAFYIVNSIHDITYRYGFTESAFNFQNDNFGHGGSGNDRVLVSVQDKSGTNNANFATPADGQSGQMRMYLWTLTSPQRDGALENDIIVHEMTHGITNRMTGGGTGRCLQTTESGGMGEGWSDAMASWTEKTSEDVPDYVMGQYVTNKSGGIRTHPYSTNANTNPLRYSSIAQLNEVHNIGEVWANMLHNVYAALVDAHGWSANARTDATGSQGNVVHLHLFLDALAIQPCNPTFTQARDAWIQADATRYGGANKCILWKAFASRGLGVGAANFRDSSTLPSGC